MIHSCLLTFLSLVAQSAVSTLFPHSGKTVNSFYHSVKIFFDAEIFILFNSSFFLFSFRDSHIYHHHLLCSEINIFSISEKHCVGRKKLIVLTGYLLRIVKCTPPTIQIHTAPPCFIPLYSYSFCKFFLFAFLLERINKQNRIKLYSKKAELN